MSWPTKRAPVKCYLFETTRSVPLPILLNPPVVHLIRPRPVAKQADGTITPLGTYINTFAMKHVTNSYGHKKRQQSDQ